MRRHPSRTAHARLSPRNGTSQAAEPWLQCSFCVIADVETRMTVRFEKLTFPGAQGATLSARLEMPEGEPIAYALFAHCFTCTKDIFAAGCIAEGLARHGIAVLRFDFTGLGASEGDFAHTSFTSNTQDLLKA